MTPLIHVKPKPVSDAPDAPLHRVRLPSPRAGELLPDDGITTEDGSFWRRREADREVEIAAGEDGRIFEETPAKAPGNEPPPPPPPPSRSRRHENED